MKKIVLFVMLIVGVGIQAAQAERSVESILSSSGLEGGLVVHLGCGSGDKTAALGASEAILVQGLDRDPEHIAMARACLGSSERAGRVTAARFDGHRLPYVDNIVNLLIAEKVWNVGMPEIMRVLRPGGTAWIQSPDGWTQKVKPWPEEIDEWTHYLHGPDNNAVAEDTVVGPPRHYRWIAAPRFGRSHDHLAGVSAMVSSGGRLFYIVDHGSIAFVAARAKWRLIARDAFNGIKLWEREIPQWEYHLRDFRSGPADVARRLVAAGDRVYVTLGYGQPVVALDAATGETTRTYTGTEGTREILLYNDSLLLVLGEPDLSWRAQEAKEIVSQEAYHPPFENTTPPARNMRLACVSAKTGKLLWTNSRADAWNLMPSTLAAADGRVYFQNPDAVICLDAASGTQQWKAARPLHRKRLAWSTPTLVVHDDIVYSADRAATEAEGDVLWIPSGGYHDYIKGEGVKGELAAFNAKTGDRLWCSPAFEGFNAPVDVLIADELLWTGRYAWGNDPGFTRALDLKSGEVRRERPPDQEFLPRIGHARCHRAKATTEFLILGRRGVEFVDLDTGHMTANLWVRGICQYGVMPANGLLYVPPHACACNVSDMLKSGFMALAPVRRSEAGSQRSEKLEKGPAYENLTSDLGSPTSVYDWPTYRHNPARSGRTPHAISADLKKGWRTRLGGDLTSPVIAGGFVLVASKDRHTVHALDAATGRPRWTFTAGARIDSPPTIDHGRVLLGSADGKVYCLRLEDGALAWSYRAAPQDHFMVVEDQLESVWPVSGSVLVVDDAVYFVAGRNSYLDGGLFLYKLDATTGKQLDVRQLEVEQEKRDRGVASGGILPDVLSSDGDSVFMRQARFDLDLERQMDDISHLWSSVGFLDDRWWHRTYWQYGTFMKSGWGGWTKAGMQVPAGRLLVRDGSRIFGFGRNQYNNTGAHVGVDGNGVWGPFGQNRWTHYRLFARNVKSGKVKASKSKAEKRSGEKEEWVQRIPVMVRAMTLAGNTLFVAGPADTFGEVRRRPEDVDPLADSLEAKGGGRLLAVSPENGKTLAEYSLESAPVFDGMAVANDGLYLSTMAGEMVCMKPAP